MCRRHDARLIKRHLSYTALELARTLRVTITTVYRWKKEGLQHLPGTFPHLFAPSEVVRFLKTKNKPRQPLAAGEIFCVACKSPSIPKDGTVELEPRGDTSADLVGRCRRCNRRIFRRVRLAELEEKLGNLNLRYGDVRAPIVSASAAPRTALFEGASS